MEKLSHSKLFWKRNEARLRRKFDAEDRPVKVRLRPYDIELLHDALENLVGQPLTHMVRAGGAQYFSFGEQKPRKNYMGEDSTGSDWGLMAGTSCHWLVTGPDGFQVGSDDFYPERKDEHAKPFYDLMGSSPIVVQSVVVTDDGVQHLAFSEGYSMVIRMPESVSRFGEPWRFRPPRSDFRGHLVLREFKLVWGFRNPKRPPYYLRSRKNRRVRRTHHHR